MSQKAKTTRTLIADLPENVGGLSEEKLQGVSGGSINLNCNRGQMGTNTATHPASLTLPAGESDTDSTPDCV